MAEYIEREALMEKFSARSPLLQSIRAYIAAEPAVDVAPVAHGRWIFDDYTKRLRCSECEAHKPYEMVGDIVDYWDCDYCPIYGARMDGE